MVIILFCYKLGERGYHGGPSAAAPLLFRLGDPALCGSQPLVVTHSTGVIVWDFLYVYVFIVLLYFVLFAFLGFLYFCSVFSFSTLILLVGSFGP